MEPLHHPVYQGIGADLAHEEDVIPLRHGLLLQHGGQLQQDPGWIANIQAPGLLQNASSDLLVLRLAGDTPVGVALLGDDGDAAGAGGAVTRGRRVHRACNDINRFGQLGSRVLHSYWSRSTEILCSDWWNPYVLHNNTAQGKVR